MTIVALVVAFLILLGIAVALWQRRRAGPVGPAANLPLLVDALPDPIILIDDHDRVLLVNQPAERLFEVELRRLVGRKLGAGAGKAALRDLLSNIRSNPERELRFIRKGQALSFQPIVQKTTTRETLIVLRDVSTAAGTAQMKTDFVANASHELRTPISAIKVAFETLRDVYPDDPAQTERCITIIGGHLTRLEEMLRDLLDLARVENPQLHPQFSTVHSRDLIDQICSTWDSVAKDRQVRLHCPETPAITFETDRRLLDLVLKNLIENAIKFTPAGGTVTVTVQQLRDEIELCVSDTGCGIPHEHIERVFERFYQVDSARSSAAGRGTGLGLAIIKHAVHALGGTVKLTSQVGQGTTAICTFPRRLSSAAQ